MTKRILGLLAASTLLATAAAYAQSTPTPEPATPATSTGAGSASATSAPTREAGPTAGMTPLQGQDATFVRKALEGDRAEIAQAQQALNSAERNDTKIAARQLLDDHQRSTQELQQLATSKGWTLPAAGPMESDQSRSNGAFDDDRFMADQIRAHRDAITLYRTEATSGTDPQLRQFARDQLPALEHHLEVLQGANTRK
jgi:putative membrane protein